MAESREEWIRKRAYALWEEEGYPADKDREHWERATLEHAAQHPTASSGSKGKKSATAVKTPQAAPAASDSRISAKSAGSKSAGAKPSASKEPAAKALAAKAPAKAASSSKSKSKAPAAMPEAVEPVKKRSKKALAGE